MRVVEMLNKMYTTFDQLIEKHGVYKVKGLRLFSRVHATRYTETVGDAYMITELMLM